MASKFSKEGSSDDKREQERAYQDRVSMKAIKRIFGVSSQTLVKWLKKALSSLLQSLLSAQMEHRF
ncbi:MAG: hypothetical protein NZ805_02015 [Armatimonadetes bacterium]|nr:hypothetical protein [Armatimonadota bacterium]MDW8026853.1 hypothetical protein [Armatimonadota bacterium]